jgi:Effector Associated Constant Component 1
MSTDTLAVTLTSHTDRYHEDDERWIAQVAELRRELRIETGAVQLPPASEPGKKGSVDQLVLALGSADVFSTALAMLGVWLARDKTRSVKAKWTDDAGVERQVTLSADNADAKTLAPLVEAVARRISTDS